MPLIMLFLLFFVNERPSDVNSNINDQNTEMAVSGSAMLEFDSIDDSVAKVLSEWSKMNQVYIEDFFQVRFKNPYILKIHSDRSSLNKQWRLDWGYPDFNSQCWMVASGVGSRLDILSPRVWAEEACEHDPEDSLATQQLFLHEMVHTFHGQNNPSPSFNNVKNLGWYLEGLAVYVSGQLDDERLEPVIKMVSDGTSPSKLSDMWKGNNRYGQSGSMVKYIDQTWGRKKIMLLLRMTSADEALNALEITEEELLQSWKQWLLETQN